MSINKYAYLRIRKNKSVNTMLENKNDYCVRADAFGHVVEKIAQSSSLTFSQREERKYSRPMTA